MKILAVVVEELPQSCCECPLMGKNEDLGYCIAGEELEPEYPYRRPDWCPLTTHYMASLIRGEGGDV
jgi:hypothetical protein